jgi:hypothetical protein
MASSDFERLVLEFAKKNKQEAAEEAVDWDEQRKWWIQRAQQLFDQIESWLRPLIDSGTVTSVRSKVFLNEQDLGRYEIESLKLELAGRNLTIVPEGSMFIGVFGSMAVSGPRIKAVLLLLNTDKDVPPTRRRDHTEWFITQPSPIGLAARRARPERHLLTEQSFKDLFAAAFGIGP